MKISILFLFIVINTGLCFAQTFVKKQILIPLDNKKGVPFRKDIEVNDFFINGFEIDSKGNFYFLGGEKSICLAVFSGSKLIYRRIYSNMPLSTTQLYLSKDTLYTFDRLPPNKLFVLNPSNGALIMAYENSISEKINSYYFEEDHLIISSLSSSVIIYNKYTLTGRQVGNAINRYNLPFTIPANCEFLGMWGDKFVFYMISGKNFNKQEFYLTNKSGEILVAKFLANNNVIFGEGYGEDPPEDRKVRNGNLYVLGRRGNFALITEIPLQNFFYPKK